MVYPWAPYVARQLSDPELLTALDVPAEKIKGAGPEIAHRWTRELTLPFKVRAEVSKWLYASLTPIRTPKCPACKEPAETSSKRQKAEMGHPEVVSTTPLSYNLPPAKDE